HRGCAAAHEIPQTPPRGQAASAELGPGWHSLSPYFALDIKPNSRATFYYFSDRESPKTRKAIGRQSAAAGAQPSEFVPVPTRDRHGPTSLPVRLFCLKRPQPTL